jgi:L-asparaginase II
MSVAGTVRVLRGGHVESVHRFVWRLCEVDGTVRHGGDIGWVFLRSSVKPFQALPAVRAGVLERFGLDERHLAVGCASHGGGDAHVARVSEILQAAGLTEDSLACGPAIPRDPRAAAALAGRPRRIHHNCSGKHALGLALCVADGWPVENYLEAGHPLQSAMREAIADATHAPAHHFPDAIDGCGMRTYALALEGLAIAFARLASDAMDGAAGQVAHAMREHPMLVGHPGSVDSEIMAATPGTVAKIGAEGVMAIGTADGRGLAVKVLDGNARALDPAAVLCARELLGLAVDAPAFDALATPPLMNSRGEVVGELQAVLKAPAQP